MKKTLWVFLLAAVLLLALPVLAGAESSGVCGEHVTWTLDDSGQLTISGTGPMEDFPEFPTLPYGNEITKVVVEQGVTHIGDWAFNRCYGLTGVSIPGSVTSIGANAFYFCTHLRHIVLPGSIADIGDAAFMGCSALYYVNIPAPVTAIGQDVFHGCENLTEIIIPDSVTGIGVSAFSHTGLTGIVLPDSVTGIGNGAFSHCGSLTHVSLPQGITVINGNTFDGCGSLVSISIPDSVTSIDWFAFRSCGSMTGIVLPDQVASIGGYAFAGCGSLKNVTVPGSVTSIRDNAFADCPALTSITLPPSVNSLGNRVLDGCPGLEKAVIASDTLSFGEDVFGESKPVIYCYEYSDADFWAMENGCPVEYLDGVDPEAIRTLTLEPDFQMLRGETRHLAFNLFPNDGAAVSFVSSHPEAVSVTAEGVVTALEAGRAAITVTVGDVSAAVNIEVCLAAEDFQLSTTDLWIISKTSAQISVISMPEGSRMAVAFSSADTGVAAIDADGHLSAYRPGSAMIKAVGENGKMRTCLVHVCYPVTGIEMEPECLTVGEQMTVQLTARVSMRTQSCVNQLVTWSSSDESVAAVNESGLVTGVGVGDALITAAADSGVSASVRVTVAPVRTLTLPGAVTGIESEAFAGLEGFAVIVLPGGVQFIADDAFDGSTVTLSAPAGSYAEAWAGDHGIPFLVQEAGEETPDILADEQTPPEQADEP